MISMFWKRASAVPAYQVSPERCEAGRISKPSLRSGRKKFQPRCRCRIRLCALYLGRDPDPPDAGVYGVGQSEVDNAALAAEIHRRLGSDVGEFQQSGSAASRQDVRHGISDDRGVQSGALGQRDVSCLSFHSVKHRSFDPVKLRRFHSMWRRPLTRAATVLGRVIHKFPCISQDVVGRPCAGRDTSGLVSAWVRRGRGLPACAGHDASVPHGTRGPAQPVAAFRRPARLDVQCAT